MQWSFQALNPTLPEIHAVSKKWCDIFGTLCSIFLLHTALMIMQQCFWKDFSWMLNRIQSNLYAFDLLLSICNIPLALCLMLKGPDRVFKFTHYLWVQGNQYLYGLPQKKKRQSTVFSVVFKDASNAIFMVIIMQYFTFCYLKLLTKKWCRSSAGYVVELYATMLNGDESRCVLL